MLVVADQVFLQNSPQMPFVQDDKSVKAFTTEGSDHAFCISVFPRRSRGRYNILDPKCGNSPFYGKLLFRIAVSNQILTRRLKRKRFSKSLHFPLGGWVRGNIGMDHTPTCMVDDDKDIQHVECHSRHSKEVDSCEHFAMI